MPLKNVELLKLGYRIRGARKVLGYTQKIFAAKCGLDRSYLGAVESGERNVTSFSSLRSVMPECEESHFHVSESKARGRDATLGDCNGNGGLGAASCRDAEPAA